MGGSDGLSAALSGLVSSASDAPFGGGGVTDGVEGGGGGVLRGVGGVIGVGVGGVDGAAGGTGVEGGVTGGFEGFCGGGEDGSGSGEMMDLGTLEGGFIQSSVMGSFYHISLILVGGDDMPET